MPAWITALPHLPSLSAFTFVFELPIYASRTQPGVGTRTGQNDEIVLAMLQAVVACKEKQRIRIFVTSPLTSASWKNKSLLSELSGPTWQRDRAPSPRAPAKKHAGAGSGVEDSNNATAAEADEKPDISRNWDVQKVMPHPH